ncbi:MAG: WbqC family protein [Dysgonamonadaceae bacterium]|jgi:hypothetical protein|nr:WbqC family protein [Dysgonamonadaceae bacterium]
MKTVLLSTAYLAPVEYYMQLNNAERVIIEKTDHYVKQTYRNRCIIATTNGLQTLSIPVVKPDFHKCYTKDMRIADHGSWRHLHWNAIVSAYSSTPFFEYYTDDFRPFYEYKYKFLFDFNEQLRELICRLLDIYPDISYSSCYVINSRTGEMDLREVIHPKKESRITNFKPYYQVFESKYGFQSNLSIIDLLFNMGPETILYL